MEKKNWTKEEKKLILLEVLTKTKSIQQISKEYGISDRMLYRWKQKAIKLLDLVFSNSSSNIEDSFNAEKQRLMNIIGEQTYVIDTLKKISKTL